jgi:hypothetical protein
MENEQKLLISCGIEEFKVLSCSGSSDIGYIANQEARMLSRNNVLKMNCLTIHR